MGRVALKVTALAAATLGLALFAGRTAWADMMDDCAQLAQPELTVRGCTAVIDDGRWTGIEFAWAYNNRGAAFAQLGRYQEAIRDFDETIRLEPGDPAAHANRGFLLLNTGLPEQAIADFDTAIGLDPAMTGAYRGRGDAFYDLDQFQRAIDDYDRALALGGLNAEDAAKTRALRAEMQTFRAWELYAAGEMTAALAYVDAALTVMVGNPAVIDNRAHILAALGRHADAIAAFELAMQSGGEGFVHRYQEALAGHGYDPGPIDGVYGAATRTALVACIEAGCRLMW